MKRSQGHLVSSMGKGKRDSSTAAKVAGRPVILRVNRRARRLIVKVHPATGEISVVAPSRSALPQALKFARGQEAWIARRLAVVPELVPLAPGSRVPFMGVPHIVKLDPDPAASVSAEPGRIIRVSGPRAQTRLVDFLKSEAKRVLQARSQEFSAKIGARVKKVSVRDAESRWGSCSRSGAIAYSWRLILAPPEVLDYVVAHEVAHLREMHHGARFWDIVRALVGDTRLQRAWLRHNGAGLHRYVERS